MSIGTEKPVTYTGKAKKIYEKVQRLEDEIKTAKAELNAAYEEQVEAEKNAPKVDYIVTMHNSAKNRTETYTTKGYEQSGNELEIFEMALDIFVDGGYSIVSYSPLEANLSDEQKRILAMVHKQLNTERMGIFVSGLRSFIVTDEQKERITFYSETDGGEIYDDCHKIDLTAVVDQ